MSIESTPSGTSAPRPIASDTVIDPRAIVEPGCSIGPGSVIHGGVSIGAGAWLGDNVRVDSNATLEASALDPVRIERDVLIGANATVCAGVTIAARSIVRPGAVVNRNVPPSAIVEGNPAVIVGYVDAEVASPSTLNTGGNRAPLCEETPVRGVTLHQFPVIPDLRGNLTVGEFERQIPFVPKRYFMVFGVPSREIRGEHAHLECHQFLICVRGSCSVVADDGRKRVEVLLSSPATGIYLPPMTWGIQYKYSEDALLLVFASHHYDNADYVRDYGQYVKLVLAREPA